jgi:hypothetical protein
VKSAAPVGSPPVRVPGGGITLPAGIAGERTGGVFAEYLDILAGSSELHDCGQESRLFVVATDWLQAQSDFLRA